MAWATAEHLARKINAFTLFATHYFELTQLAEQIDNIHNVHLDALSEDQHITFLYKVEAGPTNRSYGIEVARLAGLPAEVWHAAQHKLQSLEQARPMASHDTKPTPPPWPKGLEQTLEQLRALNPNELTPRQALNTFYHLKSLLED